MSTWRVTAAESTDIAFALDALIAGVITPAEFAEWIHTAAADNPGLRAITEIDPTDYAAVTQCLGFVPVWDCRPNETRALHGVGYSRFPDYHSPYVGPGTALTALSKHPDIGEWFSQLFPDIVWEPKPVT